MGARKKPEPKAILATKHDFVASLDRMLEKAMMLLQLGDSMLQHGVISNKGIEQMFIKQLAEFKASIFVSEEPGADDVG